MVLSAQNVEELPELIAEGIFQSVVHPGGPPLRCHQPSTTELPEVVGYRGLRKVFDAGFNFADAELTFSDG